jgi:thymidylate synthase (FAD)
MGTDDTIIESARVSTQKNAKNLSEEAKQRFINRLMRDQHGSPFESCIFRFRLHFPIAMSREQVRHRMQSINEESARYSVIEPEYYIPGPERKLVQIGKAMDYIFEEGTPEQRALVEEQFKRAYEVCDDAYRTMLDAGIAREVARFVNPVGLYTTMIVTLNLRSLMNYLSLRQESEHSHPQAEINIIANQMEDAFKEYFPKTWQAYVECGRVKP